MYQYYAVNKDGITIFHLHEKAPAILCHPGWNNSDSSSLLDNSYTYNL